MAIHNPNFEQQASSVNKSIKILHILKPRSHRKREMQLKDRSYRSSQALHLSFAAELSKLPFTFQYLIFFVVQMKRFFTKFKDILVNSHTKNKKRSVVSK